MELISARSIRLLVMAVGWLVQLVGAAAAQPGATSPAPSTSQSDPNTPAYTVSADMHITIWPDLTASIKWTRQFKILRESAIATLGQQTLPYVESLNPIEVVEAYTQKADGRKVMLEQDRILTRDAVTGLNAVYQRDARVKTLIFPDIQVGDTLVFVSIINWIDKRFPGHFSYRNGFPRSTPYGPSRVTVDAPKSIGLRVHVKGEGLTHEVTDAGENRYYVLSYRPDSWAPEEPGAVSFVDRDPQFVITTFNDLTELGASYWSSMKERDVIDPEIQALADDITKGIEDKRKQATAIDHWVKKNIRYVLVFLGSGGITPNSPTTVLKNKYGDCKDHVALMGALLKAKGIASEQALINVGTGYRLPELPSPSFNHVILYLPGFDLYTDPTIAYASFAVLSESSYDKPVLHISNAGVRAARTPPMKPADHVTIAKTTARIGADGTVKGTTRQTATGIFATRARGTASQSQTQGREKFAEAVLRNLGTPGTGIFEPVDPFDFSEPFSIQGEFSLVEKLQTPLRGIRNIPFGMPIQARPSVGLLGQRVVARKADFFCYAGKQVEEIALTFAAGLPLPRAIRGDIIDNGIFSYRASYTIEGRTLMIRREFISKVTRQVCAKEMESEMAEPLQQVSRSLRTQMSF
jgi:transglutaminase-like putative cysteine protease